MKVNLDFTTQEMSSKKNLICGFCVDISIKKNKISVAGGDLISKPGGNINQECLQSDSEIPQVNVWSLYAAFMERFYGLVWGRKLPWIPGTW